MARDTWCSDWLGLDTIGQRRKLWALEKLSDFSKITQKTEVPALWPRVSLCEPFFEFRGSCWLSRKGNRLYIWGFTFPFSVPFYSLQRTQLILKTHLMSSLLKFCFLPSFLKTWCLYKKIMLSGRSQTEKAIYCIISCMWLSGKDKILGLRNRSMAARSGVGVRDWVQRGPGNFLRHELFRSWWWWWLQDCIYLSKSTELYTKKGKFHSM